MKSRNAYLESLAVLNDSMIYYGAFLGAVTAGSIFLVGTDPTKFNRTIRDYVISSAILFILGLCFAIVGKSSTRYNQNIILAQTSRRESFRYFIETRLKQLLGEIKQHPTNITGMHNIEQSLSLSHYLERIDSEMEFYVPLKSSQLNYITVFITPILSAIIFIIGLELLLLKAICNIQDINYDLCIVSSGSLGFVITILLFLAIARFHKYIPSF